MVKKEDNRLSEMAVKTAEFKAMQAQAETVSDMLSLLLLCFYLLHIHDNVNTSLG